ncbi:hypothetical protein STENM223S_09890 [Streptomyces tendae]
MRVRCSALKAAHSSWLRVRSIRARASRSSWSRWPPSRVQRVSVRPPRRWSPDSRSARAASMSASRGSITACSASMASSRASSSGRPARARSIGGHTVTSSETWWAVRNFLNSSQPTAVLRTCRGSSSTRAVIRAMRSSSRRRASWIANIIVMSRFLKSWFMVLIASLLRAVLRRYRQLAYLSRRQLANLQPSATQLPRVTVEVQVSAVRPVRITPGSPPRRIRVRRDRPGPGRPPSGGSGSAPARSPPWSPGP